MRINSFEIRNFRAFRELRLDGLQRVNLITGENNVGKTALLEALWQLSGFDQPEVLLRLDHFRGIQWIDPENPFGYLFYGYDQSIPIELTAKGDQDPGPRVLRIETRLRKTSRTPVYGSGLTLPITDSSREIVLTYHNGTDEYVSRGWFTPRLVGPGVVHPEFETHRQGALGQPACVYLNPRHRPPPQEEANELGELQVRGREDMIIDTLRLFEPRLQRLLTISIDGLPVIHADLGQHGIVPMGLLGEGMQRLLSLTLAFNTASGGMVLVDEVENGIHHSRISDLWRAISSLSERFDVQVFATTHSFEFVWAAHGVFEPSDPYDFRFMRLDRIDGMIEPKSFSKMNLTTAIEARWEIR